MIKVLLADDHKMVTEGFSLLLATQADIEVVDTAENGQEVIDKLDQQEIDVLVMDIAMPGINGVDATRILKAENPDIKILIVSMHKSATYISTLVQLGVNGYILKDKGSSELAEAIRKIYQGKLHFGPDVANTLFSGIRNESQRDEEQEHDISLTRRETEVLRLIADGLSSPEIADKLLIATSTVDTHRKHIIAKTKVKNAKELIRWAIKNGYAD